MKARALIRTDLARLRRMAGWTLLAAGALHALAQGLPLLARGL